MKSSLIIQEAKEVKAFVEKNKELPKYCTINGNEYSIYTTAYLFAKLLKNKNASTINVITIQAPNKKFKDNIKEDIVSADYYDMIKRFIAYCEENKRVPAYVTSIKSKTQVSFELFTYCLSKIITYYYSHNNTSPLYCTFNSKDFQNTVTKTTTAKKTAKTSTVTKPKVVKKTNCDNPYTSTPHYLTTGCNALGQCTGYWCGPHSIHQAMRKFGITKYTEKQIAAWCGTTTSGTGHQGINTGIAQIGKKSGKTFKVQWKNFSDMGKTDAERFKEIAKILCQPNKAIIWHIAYINGGSGTSGKHFGHYEYVDKINVSTKYVRALNSLGDKKSDGSYLGRLQDRKYDIQSYFAKNTPGGQPALCIITKE